MRARKALVCLLATAALAAGAPPAGAEQAPVFQLPFTCGETWRSSTFSDHEPSNSVDWNHYPKDREIGKVVRASLDGTVTQSDYEKRLGYGHNVEISHGNGWSTFYAHLDSRAVSVGQRVSQGQVLGVVGATSATERIPTHLHYEQRHRGSVVKAVIARNPVTYLGHEDYTSRNGCSSSEPGGAAGTVNTAGAPLTVRSGPGAQHAARGTIKDGTTVKILCQVEGTRVSGTHGVSRLWDKIGEGRYVSDAYVFTGSDGRVAPNC